MQENVILVDEYDQEVGRQEKLQAHLQDLRHRAFSIFVLREHQGVVQVLLHQREIKKYHSGGLWTNTCCGHPRPGESVAVAASRRLMEEMGLATFIQEIGVFSYEAELQPGLWENEIDHVFIGWYKGEDFQVNPTEVMNHGWFSFEELPKNLTVWFAPAFSLVKGYLEKLEAL